MAIKLRALICTQVVDLDDPVLGFFHHWIEMLADRADSIVVICLKQGRTSLPPSVKVISLGKESGASRLKYLWRFYISIWDERHNYDTVFVHMNEIYVLLAGWWWRLTGKRINLWRNHPQGSWMTPLTVALSNHVFCTSPQSYTARYSKTERMPAGIDTEIFRPIVGIERQPGSILFLSRISPIKHPEVLIQALAELKGQGELDWRASLVGDPLPTDQGYYIKLRSMVNSMGLKELVRFLPSITQVQAPALYSAAGIFVNCTPSGSFDKTVLEALACGCRVVASNRGFADLLDERYLFADSDPKDLARKIRALSQTPSNQADVERERLRRQVIEKHALAGLIEKLIERLRK